MYLVSVVLREILHFAKFDGPPLPYVPDQSLEPPMNRYLSGIRSVHTDVVIIPKYGDRL